jgi:addiction module HigA family antidote
MKTLDTIRPGEILLKEFIEPNAITLQQIASSLGWSLSLITAVVDGSQPITDDIATGLGRFFSVEPQFWWNLQIEYDRRTV